MKIFKNKQVKSKLINLWINSSRVWRNNYIRLLLSLVLKLLTISQLWIGAKSNDFFDKPFCFAELNLALESKNVNLGSGLDCIDFFSLNKLPINLNLFFLTFLMKCIDVTVTRTVGKSIFYLLHQETRWSRAQALSSCTCKIVEPQPKIGFNNGANIQVLFLYNNQVLDRYRIDNLPNLVYRIKLLREQRRFGCFCRYSKYLR